MEVLLLSSEMLGDAGSTLFALLSSIKRRPLFARQNKCFLRIADSRRAVLDDPTELLGRARIRFRSTKRVLLARKQFINDVWNCTRNGFGARKTPAERSSSPNVLYLSSGMPLRRSNHCIHSARGCRDAQSVVFVARKQLAARVTQTSSFLRGL